MFEIVILSGILFCADINAPELCDLEVYRCEKKCETDACAKSCIEGVMERWTRKQ